MTIINFQTTLTKLFSPMSYPGAPGASFSAESYYKSDKTSGSEIGHVIEYNNEDYLVKAGNTLSLLATAWRKFVNGSQQNIEDGLREARRSLNFLVLNFTRLNGINDSAYEEALTNYLFKCFQDFSESELGVKLKCSKETLTTETLYQVYSAIADMSPCEDLDITSRDLIIFPAFADIVHGSFSQLMNNEFQKSQNFKEVATQKLFIQPQGHMGFFMASKLIDAQPFDRFLLDFFPLDKLENGEIDDCLASLKNHLSTRTIRGLASAILLRHVFGESADLGPDNMLLKSVDENTYQIVNIDVTGFRFQRDSDFIIGSTTRFGWSDTIASGDSEVILGRLFDKSVFSSRFIKDKFKRKNEQIWIEPIMDKISQVLSEHISPFVLEEVSCLKVWFKSLDAEYTTKSLAETMREAYHSIDEKCKFGEEYLDVLIRYDTAFIEKAVNISSANSLYPVSVTLGQEIFKLFSLPDNINNTEQVNKIKERIDLLEESIFNQIIREYLYSHDDSNELIYRNKHGGLHVSRTAIYSGIFVDFLKQQNYIPALDLSFRDCFLIKLACIFHDSGRLNDTGRDLWEEESAKNLRDWLSKAGFEDETKLSLLFQAIYKKDEPEIQATNIFALILAASDCLDWVRSHGGRNHSAEFEISKMPEVMNNLDVQSKQGFLFKTAIFAKKLAIEQADSPFTQWGLKGKYDPTIKKDYEFSPKGCYSATLAVFKNMYQTHILDNSAFANSPNSFYFVKKAGGARVTLCEEKMTL